MNELFKLYTKYEFEEIPIYFETKLNLHRTKRFDPVIFKTLRETPQNISK